MEQQNQIICCAGRKGAGKSTKAAEILREARRLFIYDTMGEHRWIPDRFTELSAAEIYLMETPNHAEFMGAYIPEDDDEDKDFETICSVVYQQGNMLFGIEEVVMLGMSPNHAPKKFKRIVRLGRHNNIDLLWTTQRIGECWTGLRAATDIFVLFAHTEPKDLDAIAERCGVEIAKKVAAFRGHECVVYDVNRRAELPDVPELFAALPIQQST